MDSPAENRPGHCWHNGRVRSLHIQGVDQNLSQKRVSACLSIIVWQPLVVVILLLPPEVMKEGEL